MQKHHLGDELIPVQTLGQHPRRARLHRLAATRTARPLQLVENPLGAQRQAVDDRAVAVFLVLQFSAAVRARRLHRYRFDVLGVAVLHRLAAVTGVPRLGPAGLIPLLRGRVGLHRNLRRGSRGTERSSGCFTLQPPQLCPQPFDLLLLPVNGALLLQTTLAEVEIHPHHRLACSAGSCQTGAALFRNRCCAWRHSGYT